MLRNGKRPASMSRRDLLRNAAAAAAMLVIPRRLWGAGEKPLRGVFPIMSTPFTETKALDYQDLAKEVDFLDRCGVHGMVWPQLASEYSTLSKEERTRGMEVLAKAIQGRRPALVLGVQGPNTEAALEYVCHAETLAPDALIAIPPTEAKTLEDFRVYYRAIAGATKRPVFIQTTGGPRDITPEIDFLVELAREFPQLGYVKEEFRPVVARMKMLIQKRPTFKAVFTGNDGRSLTYEMRFGSDGTMPKAPFADVYVQVWQLFQGGQREKALEVFSKLLLVINGENHLRGLPAYMMKRRGVFKTAVSRQEDVRLAPDEIEELEYNLAALKPYLRV